MSNTKGSNAYITDFPYPVDKETNVFRPATKEVMASTCLVLREVISISLAATLEAT